MVFELVSIERAQRLKELYEIRYNYVYIMDSIEGAALFGGDNSRSDNQAEFDDDILSFQEQVSNVQQGEYITATFSITERTALYLGIVYIGYDYLFFVIFTNTFDRDFINLRVERSRYESIFNATFNMLF